VISEILQVIKDSPAANNILAALALLCDLAAIYSSHAPPRSRMFLGISGLIALCIPVYSTIRSSFQFDNAGLSITHPFWTLFVHFAFAPTNFILIWLLMKLKTIERLVLWARIAFICIVLSWLGIALLYYSLG
jgi:hypothetical protein